MLIGRLCWQNGGNNNEKRKRACPENIDRKAGKNEPLFVMIEGNVIISGEFENLADLHARTAAYIAHLMLSLEWKLDVQQNL